MPCPVGGRVIYHPFPAAPRSIRSTGVATARGQGGASCPADTLTTIFFLASPLSPSGCFTQHPRCVFNQQARRGIPAGPQLFTATNPAYKDRAATTTVTNALTDGRGGTRMAPLAGAAPTSAFGSADHGGAKNAGADPRADSPSRASPSAFTVALTPPSAAPGARSINGIPTANGCPCTSTDKVGDPGA